MKVAWKEAQVDIGQLIVASPDIRHNGTGIAANIIDKVINPFFSTKPNRMGTGLGLSISHGIISEHGGKLLINSVEGEFTIITINLPITGDGEE